MNLRYLLVGSCHGNLRPHTVTYFLALGMTVCNPQDNKPQLGQSALSRPLAAV